MSEINVAILHPGQMGASIAAAIATSGRRVCWASQGRSEQSRLRAERAGLHDLRTLEALCSQCRLIVSVCPSHAAGELARAVLDAGFRGTYLDANAVSPEHARSIEEACTSHGTTFIDGSIIGPPGWKPGTTRIYLSGRQAADAARLFDGSAVEAIVVGDSAGKASALKMCFSAYSKGSTALLSAILAAAERLGVREELGAQWSADGSGFAEKTTTRVREATQKAWRFSGEMEEIAETFGEAGLPGGFHLAAAEIYRRLSGFRSAQELPGLEEVLAALLQAGERPILPGSR